MVEMVERGGERGFGWKFSVVPCFSRSGALHKHPLLYYEVLIFPAEHAD
jgi:hypothetical protein